MTKLLDEAVESLRALPADAQDALALFLLGVGSDEGPILQSTDEDDGSFDESIAREERGEFATDAQIRAIWAKHGL